MNRPDRLALQIYRSPWLPRAIILMGMVLRVRQYVFNRSLWLDEAMLSLNLAQRGYASLTRPLDYNQAAPVGFLLAERLALDLLGNHEYALRLLPLICGLAALVLIYQVALAAAGRGTALISLGLLALSPYAIQYSTEAKQYGPDLCVALLLYRIAAPVLRGRLSRARALLLGIAGAAAIWCSHPALFVLAGLGAALALALWPSRSRSQLGMLAGIGAVWGISLRANYVYSLRATAQQEVLKDHWRSAFLRFPPRALIDVRDFVDALLDVLASPGGLPLRGLAALLAVIGIVSLWPRDRPWSLSLLAPPVLTAIASVLQLYPFDGRLLMFLAPSLLILIGAGLSEVPSRAGKRGAVLAAMAALLLFFHPALSAANEFLHPRTSEEIRPVLAYLEENRQPGDAIYVYYGAGPAFAYYQQRYDLEDEPILIGIQATPDWRAYRQDLSRLQEYGRAWILFSHVSTWTGVDEERLLLFFLDEMGVQREVFCAPGAAVYGYDLAP